MKELILTAENITSLTSDYTVDVKTADGEPIKIIAGDCVKREIEGHIKKMEDLKKIAEGFSSDFIKSVTDKDDIELQLELEKKVASIARRNFH